MNNKTRQRLLLIFAIVLFAAVMSFIQFSNVTRDKKAHRIGFIMTGESDESGWNGMNYSGIKAACEEYGVELMLKENITENSGMCISAVSELVSDGAEMIILSSYGYPAEARDVIAEYPEIAFYGNSAEYYTDNLTSYFGRMYQARYLSGIVAGMQTETDKIGYIAATPNVEVNRGINAFTLGVKRVNPEAEVIVSWTGSWDNEEKGVFAVEELVENEHIDVVTYHQNRPYVIDAAEKAGICSIGYNEAAEGYSEKYLTAAVWDWEHLYRDIVKDFVQGKANTKQHHWCGIETGAVALSEYSSLVSEEARAEVEKAKEEILGRNDVFTGEIYDNNNVLRCGADENISDSSLMTEFDWYVDGVRLYEE